MRKSQILLVILVVAGLVGGAFNSTVFAQGDVYDHAWLMQVVSGESTMEDLMNAWMDRDVRSEQKNAGTYDVPANSVVFGSPMNAGNNPAFEELAPEIFYTPEGGRFGATEAFRSFQLDGAYHGTYNDDYRPANIDEMIALALAQPDYGRMITVLDVEWSNSPHVINRWGSSGPLELLTEEQIETIGRDNLQELVQLLPGNTLVWGELSERGDHWGLVRIADNLYATTCQGGEFRTLRGFRAMQFAAAALNSIIPDMDGCAGTYPVLDPDAPASAQPLEQGTPVPTQ